MHRKVVLVALVTFASVLLAPVVWFFLMGISAKLLGGTQLEEVLNFILALLTLIVLPILISTKVVRRMLTSPKQAVVASALALGALILIAIPIFFAHVSPILEKRDYCASLGSAAPDECFTFLENSNRTGLIYPVAAGYAVVLIVIIAVVNGFGLRREQKT